MIVWGETLTRQSLENAKRLAGKDAVVGACLKRPTENIKVRGVENIFLLPNESSILAMGAKGDGDVLFLPREYKALPHFLKTVTPILLSKDAALITWDFDAGYSAKSGAERLFFCLSHEGCLVVRRDLNGINGLPSHHIPERLFCQP